MYKKDRKFTDFVHKEIATSVIYNKLGWKEKVLDKEIANKIDLESGIDYIFINDAAKEIKIQERFRDQKYKNFNDFTIRYRRDFNKNQNQHQSEFYKLKADYLVYGITNTSKELLGEVAIAKQYHADKQIYTLDFIKFAIINLKVLYQKIENKQIVIKEKIKQSKIEDNRLIVPVLHNKDKSSSFIAFDIRQLSNLFSDDRIILIQKGFF